MLFGSSANRDSFVIDSLTSLTFFYEYCDVLFQKKLMPLEKKLLSNMNKSSFQNEAR